MGSSEPANAPRGADPVWAGRNVLVALTGGIACYKVATVVSRLVQSGAIVRVLMTEAATRFVTPLTFQALSGNTVITSIWQADDRPDSQHIGLARWCDLLIIAPATADILGKLANGLADDIVSLTAMALPRSPAPGSAKSAPVLLAPAMNADMWANPIVQRNLATVKQVLGFHTVGPDEGWQACRTAGPGRMSEPEAVLDAARKLIGTVAGR